MSRNEIEAQASDESKNIIEKSEHKEKLKRAHQKKELKPKPDESRPPICHSVAIFKIISKRKRKDPEKTVEDKPKEFVADEKEKLEKFEILEGEAS